MPASTSSPSCSRAAPRSDALDNGMIVAWIVGVFSVPIGAVGGAMLGAGIGGALDKSAAQGSPEHRF